MYATLPASGDGVKANVITGKYVRIPKEEWRVLERRALKMMPEDYAIIKKALYTSCIRFECDQSLDFISQIFENIDQGLGATK